MSYTYHGTSDLIPLPGRSVQTFASGLVRVERTFVCRKGDANRYRQDFVVGSKMPNDDERPAIDGLYIFPEVQELVRDDGFVEFRVTAYGRTNIFDQISIARASIKGSFRVFDYSGEEPREYSQPAINETYTLRGVISSSDSLTTVLTPPEINNPIVLVSPYTTPVVPASFDTGRKVAIDGIEYSVFTDVTVSVILDAYTSTSFGVWNEVVVTYLASGNSVTYLKA